MLWGNDRCFGVCLSWDYSLGSHSNWVHHTNILFVDQLAAKICFYQALVVVCPVIGNPARPVTSILIEDAVTRVTSKVHMGIRNRFVK